MSSQIPGYQVIRKVGEGGMSTVYLAIQLSVGREVALKVLSPELRIDPTFAERFYREANIVGRLSHPNIIAIYDVGKHDNHYYMAMDYLPGPSCKQLIKKRQIPPTRALAITKDIAEAIEYTHQQGYLHCDIKPDNILFRSDGSAVLTDFGIAREINEGSDNTTIAGTPHYMSPEQAQGQKLGKPSDIYSLGILLYEMLTGSVPFHGKDAIAVAVKHVSAPIPSLPADLQVLQPLLQRMMAKKTGARLQNGNELKHAIEFFEAQYLRQEAVSLPLKMKAQFTLHKIRQTLKNLSGHGRQLHLSLRHGLVMKLVDDDYDLPDIDTIARTLEASMLTGNTAATGSGSKSAMDLALDSDQARVIIPALLLNTLLVLAAATLVIWLGSDTVLSMMNQAGAPDIIYVD